MDILEHLGMRVRDIEGHGVITGRASAVKGVVKLREREGQRVDLGRSLKGHL